MSGNNFGKLFRITTWGESHGPATGVVIDGCPSGLELTEREIQKELDRRKPGQSNVTSLRKEDDKVEIVSGVFGGKTTGMPIALIIKNKNADPSKYEEIKDMFRPGHADFTYYKKYGIRDYRGGGRASGRETIGRVAAGAIAKKILKKEKIEIYAYARQIGNIKAEKIDLKEIERNFVRSPDKDVAKDMEKLILSMKAEGDSIGGIVEIIVKNCPVGLGDPVFDKLDADLAKALLSIGAVKGVEFGRGFEVAELKGSENNDQITFSGFKNNNAGGVLGGISTGQDLVMRIAVKPTPSISKEQETVDINNKNSKIIVKGRHDPCIVPRIVPVAESMVALVLIDKLLIQKAIGDEGNENNN
jgi:chorismate synthase